MGDGLDVLRSRPDASADAIVRDAFTGAETPGHLADETWWSEVRRVLKPSGIAIANAAARPRSDEGQRDARAARRVFGTVLTIGSPTALAGSRLGNATLVAGAWIDVDALRRFAASAPLPTVVRDAWGS